MKNLRWLDLGEETCGLTEDGVRDLQRQIPGLDVRWSGSPLGPLAMEGSS
jgi:hypothetical protein